MPEDFLDAEPEGPFPSLAAYCRYVLARRGNDADRFCDADPELAQHARLERPQPPFVAGRFVAHDGGGDFVFCSLALELPGDRWYVLEGFECDNTMNEDDYRFRVLELSQSADHVSVRASGHEIGLDPEKIYEARCGLGPSGVPRCVAVVTGTDGASSGVRFDGDDLVIGPETEEEGPGELSAPGRRLPRTAPGRYRVELP